MKPRVCGECTACCTALAVDEIHKPAWTACENATPTQGCAIYADRPAGCLGYSCMWLADPEQRVFRNMERPDRVGVVLDTTNADGAVARATGQPSIVAREVRPGAFEEPAAREMFARLQKRSLVVLLDRTERRRLIGPERLIQIARRVMGKNQ